MNIKYILHNINTLDRSEELNTNPSLPYITILVLGELYFHPLDYILDREYDLFSDYLVKMMLLPDGLQETHCSDFLMVDYTQV